MPILLLLYMYHGLSILTAHTSLYRWLACNLPEVAMSLTMSYIFTISSHFPGCLGGQLEYFLKCSSWPALGSWVAQQKNICLLIGRLRFWIATVAQSFIWPCSVGGRDNFTLSPSQSQWYYPIICVCEPLHMRADSGFLWVCYATLWCSSLKWCGWLASFVSEEVCVSLNPPQLLADIGQRRASWLVEIGRWPNRGEKLEKDVRHERCAQNCFFVVVVFF